METKKHVLAFVFLFACLLAFGLPYAMIRFSNPVYYDPDLKLTTQEPTVTATSSTQGAMTAEAFAALFSTPTGSPTSTLTGVPLPTFTFTPSPTITPTSSPTASPTHTYIPPTSNDLPDPKPTIRVPASTPRGPSVTNPAPTNPPDVSPTDPPPTSPPVLPPLISTLIPIFP